ncbi:MULTISPECIES: TRAP transporter small permease [Pseudomonadaceae]|jgi:C4-dicarboxylate transporter DctQ subunit|uniref:TRAP transporter small permease protein n=1 Tax=Stutzerimonas stutzeri TaxID=316 RepID=A0A6I6LQ26_STUST|nr:MULTISPECIES: TRAP transporter small permease [Pseudomonadaceae]BAP77531.1 tripartite ATP-independent periplasmictransporter DctQ [Pseudomonas sp. MT-1]EKV8092781.1 TRAP transporter small permease [Pseudomonas aeruginosa]EKW6389213.1 TRAP transporter small permease [Pseudomonas aeruginosa]EKW6421062.1 TRAP transporter small permease [Pseudomonas aeruginosa]MBA1307167.1 TRAP transporter small permease [Stutzerimonas stutzeri]
MNALRRAWDHFEEGFIAFLLAAMTLVTFVYVILNNLYTAFYSLGDRFASAEDLFFAMGDFTIGLAQSMTWSTALTKALFAWLIFFGLAYGVRTAGHIGVDALVKLAPRHVQRYIGVLACLFCLGYAGLLASASFSWISALLNANIGAEDLGHFGVKQWHIGMIVPIGFALVFIRFAEIFVRLLRNEQTGLGLADEAAEAVKLGAEELK